MFEGQSPENFEQKCLCIVVADVSGSMAGQPINELNKGLQDFQAEIMLDYIASQRLEVSVLAFGSQIHVAQEPALVNNFRMPVLYTEGSTRLVDAVRKAMTMVDERKAWYKNTGQNYYRPFIVLITDGEPDGDQDMNGLSNEIRAAVESKKFTFWTLGVQGYNHNKLAQICPANTPPIPLDGYKFSEFFKWLSNSISVVAKSKEGQALILPPPSGWTQIQM
jgi:uncharacterized protein YegL